MTTLNPSAPAFVPRSLINYPRLAQSTDYFSCLPPELIDTILDLASADDDSTSFEPPSRTLRPHFERVLYREICLTTPRQIHRFSESVGFEKMVLVKSLAIELPYRPNYRYHESRAGATTEPDDGCMLPTFKSLVRRLRRMVQLKHLSVQGWTRLCRLVLSPAFASSSLPSLEYLELESTFVGVEDPFCPSHFAPLHQYPRLDHFHLSVIRETDSIKASPIPLLSPPVHLTHLGTLSIYGPISASSHSTALFRCLPALRRISIFDDGEERRFDLPLLHCLPNPELINGISFDLFNPCSYDNPEPPVSFNKFPNLRNIRMLGCMDLKASLFYKNLSSLPIETLEFGEGMDLSASGLERFMEKAHHLKTLVLDNLTASIWYETEIPMMGDYERERLEYVLEEDDGKRASMDLSLSKAGWTVEFSREGLSTLLQLGCEKGIGIEGTTVDALVLQDRFESGEVERERVFAREQRAKEKARRELG